MIYEKCLVHIQGRSITHKTGAFDVVDTITQKTILKPAWVQNKLFQNASLLMCFHNFATVYFLTLKAQFTRHVIELMYKVQISPDYPTSNTN